MPLYLLIALLLAFGFEPEPPPTLFSVGKIQSRVCEIVALTAAIWMVAQIGGHRIAARCRNGDRALGSVRRQFIWLGRSLEVLSIAAYGVILFQLEWALVIRSLLGRRNATLVEEGLVIVPYVLMQIGTWWGLFSAERALRARLTPGHRITLGRHLLVRARQTLGLVLPAMAVFALGEHAIGAIWPGWSAEPWSQPVEVALIGVVIMVVSPVFIRLAWPTRSLPEGPLRDRLDHLAKRLGFHYTDILVWDTGRAFINAGVTGTIPSFRYVILTDALIDSLEPIEVSAVFGHEIGHIAHKHLLYFGFFFVASLGVLAPLGQAADALVWNGLSLASTSTITRVVQAALTFLLFGGYFLVVFGHISRRFERQADVFGSRAISCGQADCPPHLDVDRAHEVVPAGSRPCPVAIRIFANSLRRVAELNGVDIKAKSWRHGSVAQRISFLENLETRPETLDAFQNSVFRLRLGIGAALVAAFVIALATSSFQSIL